MRKSTILSAVLAICAGAASFTASAAERLSETLFNETVFYDGYQDKTIFDEALEDGIFRFRNHTYSMRLTEEFCKSFGDNAELDVIVGALCDNYDRHGSISIAFAPKGEATYDPLTVPKIEIARFITPFMNKNKTPDSVPYNYTLPDLGLILRDPSIHEQYDLWLEAYLFGVPYAANEQVAGCEGRSDVFRLTTTFTHDPASDALVMEPRHHLVPIATVRTEEHGNVNFNNFNEQATDTLGLTTKTWRFEVPADVTDAKIVLINTNHGANANGEEYVRRQHLVYVDGEISLIYWPGGVSCEPYRKYNTQPNGIYGYFVLPDWQWEEWNNWCPGQAVPIREIHLGALKAGEHSVMIRVPQAVFSDGQGDFRPALYFQGVEEGVLPSTVIAGVESPEVPVEWSNEGNIWNFNSEVPVSEARVYSYDGSLIYGEYNATSVDLSDCQPGIYIISLTKADGSDTFRKVIVK